MNCSTCKREVKETIHTLEGFKVDYYGVFGTIEGGKIEVVSITCIDCYKKQAKG